jgi:hypothetical protein
MSFYTTIDGKFTKLEEMDVACDQFIKNVQYHYNLCKKHNDWLREENVKLKSEHYKDEEIQMWKQKYEEAKEELYNGFGITNAEREKINEWQKKHDAEVHGLTDDRMRLKAGGAIGGRYHYKFLPTSIGVSGKCVCGRCGAEFEFQEIG